MSETEGGNVPHAGRNLPLHYHETEEERDACQEEHDETILRWQRELRAHYDGD